MSELSSDPDSIHTESQSEYSDLESPIRGGGDDSDLESPIRDGGDDDKKKAVIKLKQKPPVKFRIYWAIVAAIQKFVNDYLITTSIHIRNRKTKATIVTAELEINNKIGGFLFEELFTQTFLRLNTHLNDFLIREPQSDAFPDFVIKLPQSDLTSTYVNNIINWEVKQEHTNSGNMQAIRGYGIELKAYKDKSTTTFYKRPPIISAFQSPTLLNRFLNSTFFMITHYTSDPTSGTYEYDRVYIARAIAGVLGFGKSDPLADVDKLWLSQKSELMYILTKLWDNANKNLIWAIISIIWMRKLYTEFVENNEFSLDTFSFEHANMLFKSLYTIKTVGMYRNTPLPLFAFGSSTLLDKYSYAPVQPIEVSEKLYNEALVLVDDKSGAYSEIYDEASTIFTDSQTKSNIKFTNTLSETVGDMHIPWLINTVTSKTKFTLIPKYNSNIGKPVDFTDITNQLFLTVRQKRAAKAK